MAVVDLQHPREHRPDLREHQQVSSRDQLAHLLEDPLRQLEQVEVRARGPEQIQAARRRPALVVHPHLFHPEQLTQKLRAVLLADEAPRGLRGPRRERAPVRVLEAQDAPEAIRQLVVALRDQQVTQHRIAIERAYGVDLRDEWPIFQDHRPFHAARDDGRQTSGRAAQKHPGHDRRQVKLSHAPLLHDRELCSNDGKR